MNGTTNASISSTPQECLVGESGGNLARHSSSARASRRPLLVAEKAARAGEAFIEHWNAEQTHPFRWTFRQHPSLRVAT